LLLQKLLYLCGVITGLILMLTTMESNTLAARLKAQGLSLEERLKVYKDELYRRGASCLERGMGRFEAERFLDLYHLAVLRRVGGMTIRNGGRKKMRIPGQV
jgi:hypothetical protein